MFKAFFTIGFFLSVGFIFLGIADSQTEPKLRPTRSSSSPKCLLRHAEIDAFKSFDPLLYAGKWYLKYTTQMTDFVKANDAIFYDFRPCPFNCFRHSGILTFVGKNETCFTFPERIDQKAANVASFDHKGIAVQDFQVHRDKFFILTLNYSSYVFYGVKSTDGAIQSLNIAVRDSNSVITWGDVDFYVRSLCPRATQPVLEKLQINWKTPCTKRVDTPLDLSREIAAQDASPFSFFLG